MADGTNFPAVNQESVEKDEFFDFDEARFRSKDQFQEISMAKFYEKELVLCRWSDGLLYLGTVIKVDERGRKCWVKFEDGSTYWILFKDLLKGTTQDVDILCSLCENGDSNTPNHIVLCDNCGLGFHQLCHNPQIPSDVLQPDFQWFCQQCLRINPIKLEKIEKKDPELISETKEIIPLPYDLNSLCWDMFHRTNTQHCYCYCGGPGEWFIKMLQCYRCKQWFHEACIQNLKDPMLSGDRSYIFVCSVCNCGVEFVHKVGMKWRDIVHVVLFNLSQESTKPLFDFDPEIMPFLERHWNLLKQGNAELTDMTAEERRRNILMTLRTNKFRFKWGKEQKKRSTSWGLRVVIPPPAPEIALPSSGQITNDVYQHCKMEMSSKSLFVPIPITPTSATKDHTENKTTPTKTERKTDNVLIDSARRIFPSEEITKATIKKQEVTPSRPNKSTITSYKVFYKRKYTRRKNEDGSVATKPKRKYTRRKIVDESEEPKPKRKYKKRKKLIGYQLKKKATKRIPTKNLIKTSCELKPLPQSDDKTNITTFKTENVSNFPGGNEDFSAQNSGRSSPTGSGTDTSSVYSANGTQLKLKKYLPRNRIRGPLSHESNGIGTSQCPTCQRQTYLSESVLKRDKCFANCHDSTSPLMSPIHHNPGRSITQCSQHLPCHSYLDVGDNIGNQCLLSMPENHRIHRRADGVTRPKTVFSVGSPETISSTCTASVCIDVTNDQ